MNINYDYSFIVLSVKRKDDGRRISVSPFHTAREEKYHNGKISCSEDAAW